LFVVTNCKYELKTCWCSFFSYKIIISSTTEKCFLRAGFQFVNRGHSLCTKFGLVGAYRERKTRRFLLPQYTIWCSFSLRLRKMWK